MTGGVGAASEQLNTLNPTAQDLAPLPFQQRANSWPPEKTHICSLKQKQIRAPTSRVQGPRAGKGRGSQSQQLL